MGAGPPDSTPRPPGPAGRRAAEIAALLGLVPAVGLGVLRTILGEAPETSAQLFGNGVFTLIYVAPYLLTLAVSRAPDPAARGGLLLALGMVSFVASFSTFSLVTVVLLPATVAVFVAAANSLSAAKGRVVWAAPFLVAGLALAVVMGLGFFALFGLQADESRCWVEARGPGGETQWQTRPNVGGPNALSAGPTSGVGGSFCTSDIITNAEAAVGLGILAMATAGIVGVSRLGRSGQRA